MVDKVGNYVGVAKDPDVFWSLRVKCLRTGEMA